MHQAGPSTMRAARLARHAEARSVAATAGVPVPHPGADDVLVQVRAAGVNPIDWKLAEGLARAADPPFTLGSDLSGVVLDVGEGVDGIAPGDAVHGLAGVHRGGSGAFAEYALARPALLAPKPASLDHAHAAALPMAAWRAWICLHDVLRVERGERVLVHGGAGGVGSFAIQIAKHLGAHVTTTARTRDLDHVLALGADEAVDFTQIPFDEVVEGIDAVLDTVGGATLDRSFRVVRPGARVTSLVGGGRPEIARRSGAAEVPQPVAIPRSAIEGATRLAQEGILRPTIDREFPLAEVGAALDHLKAGHPRGKVVLRILGSAVPPQPL